MFVLERDGGDAVFVCNEQRMRVRFVTASVVRVTYTEGRGFQDRPSRIVVAQGEPAPADLIDDATQAFLATDRMSVCVEKKSGALSFFRTDGSLLFREPERGGKWLTPKELRRNKFGRDTEIAFAQSIDGVRATASSYESVFDRMAFEAKLEFEFSEEALFGLGSHEEGYGNLRGRSRELYQQNMKAVVPMFVSTRGYGVLLDCCSLMTFHDDALGSYLWADAVDELDYYVICGANHDEVIAGYYELTGEPAMLPKWAFGYVQSKERYVTADEMVGVVREYRRRNIPLDTIVLDWKSWPNGAGWGQKSLDPQRFPDPAAFAAELHQLGAKLMVSIWPIMTGGCADQRELLERGLMLGNQATYNAFSSDARACYWEQAQRGLFAHGVDAWWTDCTEPFEADWIGAVKPEPHKRLAVNTGESKLYLDQAEINAYSLLHSQGIYDGQRGVTEAKRVLNLTRSSYAGQHRYGTVTWNGDISASWETLRRCVPEGVNFCATGEPYWTVDAGGFFVDWNPKLWFWRGDYPEGCRGLTDMNALAPDPNDTGCRDLGYWELYTRWVQYAAFLPMMRSHGTDAAREIWRFGEEGSPFYDAIAEAIRLRYRLIPYIYSLAAGVTLRGESMVRAVAVDFPHDPRTFDLLDQYMFGRSLMVCPVIEPMVYGPYSTVLPDVARTRTVYLPSGSAWFDFHSEAIMQGGQTVEARAPLERIPVFVRAGSIVVLCEPMQWVDQVPDAAYEVRVYTGADGLFVLYEDAGDGYGYEQGESAEVEFRWTEEKRELKIGSRRGQFSGMIGQRPMNIVFIGERPRQEHCVCYVGEELHVSMRERRSDSGDQP